MTITVPGETRLPSVLRPRGMKAKLLLLLELALRSACQLRAGGGMLRAAYAALNPPPGLVPVPEAPEDKKAIA